MKSASHRASAAIAMSAVRWIHRWIGVVASLLCVMWFASGIVMMYVPFPSLTDAERLGMHPSLDASAVSVGPAEALAAAGLSPPLTSFRLEMWGREPVYRLASYSAVATVSAQDARKIENVGAEEAAGHLAEIFVSSRPRFLGSTQRDQWTVSSTSDVHRPLYKFALDDDQRTELYVSSRTGEVIQQTTRSERFWNYLGSVPHWIYFTAIRSDGAFWRQVVMWISGPVIIVAASGLFLGILRARRARNFVMISPFRRWLRWHHLSGLIGGTFLLMWIATGWLSVNPFGLFGNLPPLFFNVPSYYGDAPRPFAVTPLEIRRFIEESRAKEISFSWLANAPLMAANDGNKRISANGDDGAAIALALTELKQAAQRLLPDNQIILERRLLEEDFYWYSHRIQRPLPVVRIGFDDPGATWVHLDPLTGKILSIEDREQRLYRWIFNVFHDFDLPILLNSRPLWDIWMLVLISIGLCISLTGVILSWKVAAGSLRRTDSQIR